MMVTNIRPIVRRALATIAVALIAIAPMAASARIQLPATAMHPDDALSCTKTKVLTIGYYFQNDPSSGVQVNFATKLGVTEFPMAHAGISDRSMYAAVQNGGGEPWVEAIAFGTGVANPIVTQERVGDEVQVCLIGTPEPSDKCDPSKDARGRIYRVYDYRLHAAYGGPNGYHACGGA